MPITTFFTDFFLLLIASSITIAGWFLTTRGEKKEMPDGSIKTTGNIFRGWYFFWTQLKEEKWINYWYDEKNLILFARDVRNYVGKLSELEMKISNKKGTISALTVSQSLMERLFFIEREMGVYIEVATYYGDAGGDDGTMDIIVCKREPAYVFPAGIRKMMAECITCHASFYGSIVFVAFHLLCGKEFLSSFYGIFPSNFLFLGMLGTWIAYTFSLSYTLTFLYKKL